MDKNRDFITTMGIISNEVYDDDKIKKYFKEHSDPLEANNHTYKVLEHTPPSDTGFNALLLQDTDSDKYVIAFRGTAEKLDIFDDALIGLKNHSIEFHEAEAFVGDMIDKHHISKDNLTLTGHSLGGILTQAVGAVHEIEGVAFNPYGVDRLLSMPELPPLGSALTDVSAGLLHTGIYKVSSAFGLEAPQTQWAKDHITNVHYVDNGKLNGDPLSNFATNISSKHLGSSLLIHGDNKGFDGHSMVVLNHALAQYNQTLSHFKETDMQTLSEVYAQTGFEKTQEIFKELGVTDASANSLKLENLHDKEIKDYDLQDPATLYAIEHLNPFTIEGNLDAYKEMSIDNYYPEMEKGGG